MQNSCTLLKLMSLLNSLCMHLCAPWYSLFQNISGGFCLHGVYEWRTYNSIEGLISHNNVFSLLYFSVSLAITVLLKYYK